MIFVFLGFKLAILHAFILTLLGLWLCNRVWDTQSIENKGVPSLSNVLVPPIITGVVINAIAFVAVMSDGSGPITFDLEQLFVFGMIFVLGVVPSLVLSSPFWLGLVFWAFVSLERKWLAERVREKKDAVQ